MVKLIYHTTKHGKGGQFMNTALVIMAAGIGSRFGGGIKQLTPIGPNGELIIDYSIHDALEAGFNEVVFIIRREIEPELRAMIGGRLERGIGTIPNLRRVSCVYQELDDLPEGFDTAALAADRAKPWGTGQAILACRGVVDCPFAVINADDYYGKSVFRAIHDFLTEHGTERGHYCMAGFVLSNTLSYFGSVTRGLCEVSPAGYLTGITETRNLIRTEHGAEADGVAIDGKTPVSMNMWGFTPDFLEGLEEEFREFLRTGDTVRGEFLLPEVVGRRLKTGEARVRCLETKDRWFGVTYKEDRPIVERRIRELIDAGVYPPRLFSEQLV